MSPSLTLDIKQLQLSCRVVIKLIGFTASLFSWENHKSPSWVKGKRSMDLADLNPQNLQTDHGPPKRTTDERAARPSLSTSEDLHGNFHWNARNVQGKQKLLGSNTYQIKHMRVEINPQFYGSVYGSNVLMCSLPSIDLLNSVCFNVLK